MNSYWERQQKKHAAYWQKREAEALKNYIKDEAEYDKQIKAIYQGQLNAIDSLINEFYGRYASSEGITIAEAKKRVSKLEIERYEKKAERYVAQRNFSKRANEEMRLYNATMKINRLEMLKANIGLELIAGHDELDKFMAGILKGRTEEELERQAGILGKTIKNNAALANAIPNASFHNAKFSDRVWQYQELLKNDLSKALQTGLIQGKNPKALTKDIKKYFIGADGKGGINYAVERLMRTELARVQTDAQKQSFEFNGFSKYMFIVNGGCCPICEDVKNRKTKYGIGVYLIDKMMPGENAPPMHPHCRCSVAAYEDDDFYNEWLAFLEKGGTTAEYEAQKAKGKAKQTETKKESSFTPAKTIEEAENYIKQFVDDKAFGALGVSYAGIDVEVANEINKAIAKVFDTFAVDKFGGIVAPAGNTKLGKMIDGAIAAYSPIRNSFLVNRKTMKNMKTATKAFEGEQGSMKSLLEHPEKYDFTKLSSRTIKLIERAKVSGRATVPTSIEEALWHELGHMIEKQVYKDPTWNNVLENMPTHANNISGYAGENKAEYVAESFTAYLKGEDCVDPALVKIFEGLKK